MRVVIISCLNLLIIGIIFAQQAPTKPTRPPNVVERPVFAIQKRSLATPEAVRASLGSARVAGGVVTITGCEEDKSKRIWNPQGEPLGQVLNEIVGADSRYRWEIQDGAINLLPMSSEPPLLRTHIGEFSVRTSSTLEALNQLENRTEVKEAMRNFQLSGGLAIIMHLSNPTEFSLQFKGGTLRQALNAIAVSKGSDVWDYREIHCAERNEVTITF
jgi:hypothetical protein